MGENPGVRISVTGGGSGMGNAALINGTIQIANASREMSAEEIALAQRPAGVHRAAGEADRRLRDGKVRLKAMAAVSTA